MCTCDMFVNEIWECLYGNEAIHKSSCLYRRCGSTRMHSFAGSATGPTSPQRVGPPPLPSLQVLPALTGRASLPCPLPRSYQPPQVGPLPCPLPRSYQPPQVGPLPCPLPGPTAIPVSPHRSDPTPSSSPGPTSPHRSGPPHCSLPGPTSPHRSGPTPLPSPWVLPSHSSLSSPRSNWMSKNNDIFLGCDAF